MKKIAKTLSLYEFLHLFPSEQKATAYLETTIWGKTPICPFCKSTKSIPRPHRHGHRCKTCKKDYTIRIGTIFENSKLPLTKWLLAMYLVMTARKSISSLQLSKELGITQKSAWYLLHRIREICYLKNDLLSGIVEIDETYIGGVEKNKHEHKKTKGTQGRSHKTKAVVLGMKERGGRVKACVVNSVKATTIQALIEKNIEKGSTLSTDEALFYKAIKGYEKLAVNHSAGEFVNGMASTNGIESVWAVLKRGYYGTFHHFSKKHLARYVDEFTFRLNEGNCEVDTIDRIKSLCSRAKGRRLTYNRLIDK